MPPYDPEKIDNIEELKRKLSSRGYNPGFGHRDSFKHVDNREVPDSWGDESKVDPEVSYRDRFFMKTSVFKNFFIFSIVFFVLAIGYAGFVFFIAGNTVSNENIDISILGNTFTDGGDELSLVVGITNRNSSPLELVDLIVEYPKGGDNDAELGNERLRMSLGAIAAGTTRSENLKLVLFGQQGSVKNIDFSIEYRVKGSNAIFVKEKPYQVSINSTPVNLIMNAPDVISPNQDITLSIKSTLNATKSTSHVLLKVDYPPGFVFTSAVPKPTVGNNVWDMGDLAPGVERVITISGKMVDVFDGEEKNFRVSAGSGISGSKSDIGVVFNSVVHTVAVERPFIEANLTMNGVYQKEYAVDSRNPIQGEISWNNNLDTKIDDVEITAKISGNAFNKTNVSAEKGLYSSGSSTIVWNKFSEDAFAEVNPGDSGTVKFSILPLTLFSASEGLIVDPTIQIQVSISGKQLIEGYSPKELNGSDSKTIKIISDVGLAAKALYYSGPFKNTGPIPPKAEQPTTYTVAWSLSNTSNDISKGQVKAIIPPWVKFLDIKSPLGEDLSYNSSSREITWNVGRIPKGTGITKSDRTVSFQITLTPLLSQIQTVPVLIQEAVLTGHDDFANVDIRTSKGVLRTDLNSDSGFPRNGGIVAQ